MKVPIHSLIFFVHFKSITKQWKDSRANCRLDFESSKNNTSKSLGNEDFKCDLEHSVTNVLIRDRNYFYRPNTCLCNAVQHSGYIHIGSGKHIYFYLIESKNPKKDPLIILLSPDLQKPATNNVYSSNGPCALINNTQKNNSNSWSNEATLLFVDQLAGTGFSHGVQKDFSEPHLDLVKFLSFFFKSYSQYRILDIHIFGEYYSALHIPYYAHEIINRNNGSYTDINIKSIIIGNGFVDPVNQIDCIVKRTCQNPSSNLKGIPCELASSSWEICASKFRSFYLNGTNNYITNLPEACKVYLDQSFVLPNQYHSLEDDENYKIYTKSHSFSFLQSQLGCPSLSHDFYRIKENSSILSILDYGRRNLHIIEGLLEKGLPILIYSYNSHEVINENCTRTWLDSLKHYGELFRLDDIEWRWFLYNEKAVDNEPISGYFHTHKSLGVLTTKGLIEQVDIEYHRLSGTVIKNWIKHAKILNEGKSYYKA